jgi:DNA invertase Pin-like site-specific DNA recombinase
VDTSTPTAKMTFTVLGAVSELERSLITERVHPGIRNARAKGKRLGRPRVAVDASSIAALRSEGHSWGCDPPGNRHEGKAQRAFYSLLPVAANPLSAGI